MSLVLHETPEARRERRLAQMRLYYQRNREVILAKQRARLDGKALTPRRRVPRRATPQTREGKLEYQRAWRIKNIERVKRVQREWVQANKQKVASDSKAWRMANPEKSRQYGRKWSQENRGTRQASQARRSALKRGLLHPSADAVLMRATYRRAQEITRESGESHVVDHIIPMQFGGWHHESNLQVLPARLNGTAGKGCNPFCELKGYKSWRDVPRAIWPDQLVGVFDALLIAGFKSHAA